MNGPLPDARDGSTTAARADGPVPAPRADPEPVPAPRATVLHDYLTQRGGAERVALLLAEVFGDGELTTSAYLPSETHAGFDDVRVTELLPRTPARLKRSRATLAPLAAAAFRRHRVEADVVLCSSSGWSHWVPTGSPVVVYCYTPPRWFWVPQDYFAGLPRPALLAASALSRGLRPLDRRRALGRGDAGRHYVAISTCVHDRIARAYGLDARVVFPPTTFDPLGPQEPVPGLTPGFVLTIARERGYKNIAAAQEVFQTGSHGDLVVVGSRRQGRRGHVVDLGRVSEAQLRWLYEHCRAVLALSREDFGLTPVEGHLFGKPTLALRAGGYLDTCLDGVNAVFTPSLDEAAIAAALRCLDGSEFDHDTVVATAERFSVPTFRREMAAVLEEAVHERARATVPRPRPAPVRVHMAGSEWFAARPGGLNRYFEGLFTALRAHPGVDVTGAAFGPPVPGGATWGALAGSTARRVRASRRDPGLAAGAVLDRHFTLYGPRPRGAALVVHFQGPWAAESALAGAGRAAVAAKRTLERARLRDADRVVVLCERFRDIVVADYGAAPDRVRVIPPGVDLERFPLAPGLPVRPGVVCVRRLERRMGIDVLLRAWGGVLAAVPEATLVVVGRGSQEAALRALAGELGIDAAVTFRTDADDAEVVRRYAEATVSVVPSLALEGFGLIALESLAVGRAPVVTDCGGLPDAVRDLDPTLVVPPGDAGSLAARLVAALRGAHPDPAACRAHAERFSWAAAAAAHVDLYRELSP